MDGWMDIIWKSELSICEKTSYSCPKLGKLKGFSRIKSNKAKQKQSKSKPNWKHLKPYLWNNPNVCLSDTKQQNIFISFLSTMLKAIQNLDHTNGSLLSLVIRGKRKKLVSHY